MAIPVIVQVHLDDAADLDQLVDGLGNTASRGTAHPFDGETVAQVVALLSATTFPFFRAWIQQRIAARKTFKVVTDGVELSGYTTEEALSIISRLERVVANDDARAGD